MLEKKFLNKLAAEIPHSKEVLKNLLKLSLLQISHFTCEVDSNHRSFISKKTRENYCEGHHLVPMGKQSSYNYSLDIHANIVSLCPNCHRILHHGVK